MIFHFRKRTQEISEKTTTLSKVRKFLLYVFGLVFIFGFFAFTNKAEAAPFGGCRIGSNVDMSITLPGACTTSGGVWDPSVDRANPTAPAAAPRVAPGAGVAGATASSAAAGAIVQDKSSLSCDLTGPVMCWVASLAQLIMGIATLIIWMSGALLNYVIDLTILKMSSSIAGMTGIDVAWRVVRDVVNISFIFILVFEGILIILSQSDKGKALGMVGGIIITAVLMNFSIFFTKVIIDASNIATIGFYKSIDAAGENQNTKVAEGKFNVGISGAFTNSLKLTTLFNPDTLNGMGRSSDADYKAITIISLGGSVLFLILAFVFFAISAMFVIRYVTFIILLMFSPMGFIGWGLPKFKSIQDEWWKTLTGQAIFAPLYMFITWVILTLISSEGFFKVEDGASFGKLLSTDNGAAPTSSIGLIVNFAVIIALAIFSLTTAKKFAGQSSGYIAKATGKLTAFAGGAVMGAGAMAGRNSIGRLGNLAANSDKLKEAASKVGPGGMAARLALRTSGKAAGATFDARNTGFVGDLTGALGMEIGKGGKTTYKSVMTDKEKKQKELVDSLKPSSVATAEATRIAEETKTKAVAGRVSKQNELDDPEFIAREKKAKEDYLASPEYIKLKEAEKKEKEENDAKQKIINDEETQKTKLDKELADLEAGAKAKTAFVGKKQVDDEIAAKKLEIEDQNKKISKAKEEKVVQTAAAEASRKAANDFASDEKKKKKTELDELLKLEKEAEAGVIAVKNIWANRADSYAKTVESNKWTSLTWNAITNGVGYDTESERLAMAAKIRDQAKGKTDDQIIAEAAARKLAKENKDKENQNAPTATPAVPATTPTPAP